MLGCEAFVLWCDLLWIGGWCLQVVFGLLVLVSFGCEVLNFGQLGLWLVLLDFRRWFFLR